MNKKEFVLILTIVAIIIASSTVVSAGLFDNNGNSNIKTHEFNYANKATFNLSDELTDKTGVESIIFGQGVSYEYPAKDGSDSGLVNMLGGLAHIDGGSDDVESRQNTAFYEEIDSEPTSQGYESYIFKTDDFDEYTVFIDLNQTTIVENDGFESQYDYFWGTFQSLEEAQIFIKTFKLNEDVIK